MESSASDGSQEQKHPAECGRPDLAERLAAGEELSGSFGVEIGQHAKACPTCSVRLSLIQQAERWLSDRGSSNRAAVRGSTPCPEAEELFDYGRGPGAMRLAVATERRIEAHLVDCEECRTLIGTLATTPPAPLLDLPRATGSDGLPPLPRREGGDSPATGAPIRRPRLAPTPERVPPTARRAGPRWVVLAAAAGLLVAGLWALRAAGLFESHAASTGEVLANAEVLYPSIDSLRSVASERQMDPFGRVLAAEGTGTWQPLVFSVPPVEGATSYEFVLYRESETLEGDPTKVASCSSLLPEVQWDDALMQDLVPAQYIWEARVTTSGPPKTLGPVRFRIVAHPDVLSELQRRAAQSTSRGSTDVVLWLFGNSYWNDLRQYVRGLPQSKARDAFLTAIAGR